MNTGTDEGAGIVCDEVDTSLSCAENKASTGTQCFESEFPDEDSDIEISYSREDLDTMAAVDDSRGFKPIQSSSEELGPDPIQGWRSHGQYSVESDPNGYELDLGAVSPPSDIEEQSLGSLTVESTNETTGLEQGKLYVNPECIGKRKHYFCFCCSNGPIFIDKSTVHIYILSIEMYLGPSSV